MDQEPASDLLSNHICTALATNPDLMYSSSIDIDAVADAVRRLFRLGVLGVSDCQLAAEDKVRCYAAVRVWRVMGVPDGMSQLRAPNKGVFI